MEPFKDLNDDLTSVVEGMGFSLVEMTVARHRGNVRVGIVLYKNGGISLDDLSLAQKTLRPRLELDFGRESLSLEISSPGINRQIKSDREYHIFKGRNIRLLMGEEWTEGCLKGLDKEMVLVDIDTVSQQFPLKDIRKAKLQ